ncbi:MAG: HAMP domain-containing histidine kinase [Clostridia bacterium]|nr:HAMP domain-containing histidine kinase [Clostridia bacterium]
MRLFRNPEARTAAYISAGVAAVGVVLLLVGMWDVWPAHFPVFLIGATVIVTAPVMLILFLLVLRRHFKKVSDFTRKVEKNQSGEKDLDFSDYEEGELSILQGRVKDMVATLFCQKEQLEEDQVRLTQALADIAHQIRNPLFMTKLTARRLAEPNADPMETQLLAHRILDMTSRIDFFVTTLLAISRMDAGVEVFRPETISARELVRSACVLVEIPMELRDIRLVEDVPEDVLVHVDPAWMREALTNILTNCMQHTPAGGTVTVTVRQDVVKTTIEIRDTGTGIAEEDLPHILERYYKGKDSGSNSIGIGLALSNMIVRAMHGTLTPDNHPDGGAVFTIRLTETIV